MAEAEGGHVRAVGDAAQRSGDSITFQIASSGGTPGVPETFTGVLTRIGANPGVISTVTSTGTIPTTPLTP